MATKTISVDMVAYERLCAARSRPNESFSQVIRRAAWSPLESTGAALLARLEQSEPASEQILARLEDAQAEDASPGDPWNE